MRKIERQISQALNTPGMALNSGNTTVDWTDDQTRTDVRFHGHLIASIHWADQIVWVSDCGYQTATTKARLNCILQAVGGRASIHQSDFVWYLTRGLDATEADVTEMQRTASYCVSL